MAVSLAKTWDEDAIEDYNLQFCHGIYPRSTFEASYNNNFVVIRTLF